MLSPFLQPLWLNARDSLEHLLRGSSGSLLVGECGLGFDFVRWNLWWCFVVVGVDLWRDRLVYLRGEWGGLL